MRCLVREEDQLVKTRIFQIGDRIIDNDPFWGTGTVVGIDESYTWMEDDVFYYRVSYDKEGAKDFPRHGCPEHEMRKITKLDKALK
jgi:RNA polymerase-interacting CarD/CdnL/TRCF family regulator